MNTYKVLVIEDSPELADSLEDILKLRGYTPLIATTGKQGIDLALEHHPDLILLDIKLPDISGYDVFHTLRKDTWGAKADVMILTASESLENIAKNINLPLEDILFKPEQSVSDLLEKVTRRLNG